MLIELKRCNSIGNINGLLFLISIIAGKEKISKVEIRNRCALENGISVNCPGAVAFLEYLCLVEVVLCQDLVQHKMRNFNYFQLTNRDSLATLAL